ncbi:MAG: alpha/beta hydrolase [Gammaproteobacteria bacterium]|nr:alpha/beta hydrolase [Gammaproteobacteria bacterium]
MLLKVGLSILFCFLVLILSACSTPAERIHQEADKYGFSRQLIAGREFKHQTYRNRQSLEASNVALHVYLGGDGRPWLRPEVIAMDPTSRSPLMLRLMATDSMPSLYLGRPCYLGRFNAPACLSPVWTSGRYSETVVASMAAALQRIVEADNIKSLVFYGYSGGGALAVLLAERFAETIAVVTIAGNLDIDAWTKLHGYSALVDSINPISRAPLAANIAQLHLAGGLDSNVDKGFIAAFASKQNNSEFIVIDDAEHACCWASLWPQVLTWTSRVESVRGDSKVLFQVLR